MELHACISHVLHDNVSLSTLHGLESIKIFLYPIWISEFKVLVIMSKNQLSPLCMDIGYTVCRSKFWHL